MKKTLAVKLLLVLGSHLEFWDKQGHRLHLPRFLMSPICEAWDWHLGVYDDEIPDMGRWEDHETDSGADCAD